MAVATYNVRTLAAKGKSGYGHASVCWRRRGNFIGLQETRRSGKTDLSAVGYRVFCSGQEETEGRQGLYGVGLAVKESICRKSVYTHQLIDERLISMRFELTDECACG